MDYSLNNIGLVGEQKTGYMQTVLGPYDYWAVEYGYKQIPREEESAELSRIASRAADDPFLAFGNDVDAGGRALRRYRIQTPAASI